MDAFRNTPVKHLYKKDLHQVLSYDGGNRAERRQKGYVARHDGKVVAGLAVLKLCGKFFHAHLVAFTGP